MNEQQGKRLYADFMSDTSEKQNRFKRSLDAMAMQCLNKTIVAFNEKRVTFVERKNRARM